MQLQLTLYLLVQDYYRLQINIKYIAYLEIFKKFQFNQCKSYCFSTFWTDFIKVYTV